MTSMVRLNHVTANDFVTAFERHGLTPAVADYAVQHEDPVQMSLCALLHWENFARLTEISVKPDFKSLEAMKTHFEKRLIDLHLIETLQFLWRDEDSEPWASWSSFYERGSKFSNNTSIRARLRISEMPFGTYQCAGVLLSPLFEPKPSEAIKDLERAVSKADRRFPWTDMPAAATTAFLLLTLFERKLILVDDPAGKLVDISSCEFYTSTRVHIPAGYQDYRLVRLRIALGSNDTLLVYFDGARDSNRKGLPFLVKRLR